MRFACWITKATDTHSEYVILIAFPLQQWLRERASVSRFYAHRVSCSAINTEAQSCSSRHTLRLGRRPISTTSRMSKPASPGITLCDTPTHGRQVCCAQRVISSPLTNGGEMKTFLDGCVRVVFAGFTCLRSVNTDSASRRAISNASVFAVCRAFQLACTLQTSSVWTHSKSVAFDHN
jgi:hypothetical protein